MTLKELFDNAENNTLTWEQLQAAMGTAKFVDLTEGHYVSKQKYDSEISQKDNRISELTTTLGTRDTDLAKLQQTLKDAGDVEALKKASKDLVELQKKYAKETQEYQAQLSRQAYEFAVKDFANGKKFTSNAAKRDFVQSMIAKQLTLEEGRIIGADDFVQMYSKDNADAFVVETPPANNQTPPPQFAGNTTSQQSNHKPTLTELMQMANNNPNATINF